MQGDAREQRKRMVDQQIRSRGVRDSRVLEVMARVPRERFVPETDRALAFRDGPLSIGNGQTISQPYIVAYMTEMLELLGGERVLEIGTGSGYQAAVLAEMCREVYTVERIPELARRARNLLEKEMGYTNIHFCCGDGRSGWPQAAPFDRILATAAPAALPPAWVEQLGDSGILVAPVGVGYQRIVRLRRQPEGVLQEDLIAVSFVPCV
ncbi:MAG: protein-L-isoaspartate(D-aspartate) O-methyltransferase [Acidobacteriota bacterium]|jgi:protein-L-isoaspartate(D-aspartate) O-methyltransferase|nr:protein-L-isoaspartate(D-aspartate) O-methyltransferase [Acidobacteriota bacterium]